MQTIKLSHKEFKERYPDKYIDSYRVIGFFVVDNIEYEVPVVDYDQKVIDKIIDEAEEVKPHTKEEIEDILKKAGAPDMVKDIREDLTKLAKKEKKEDNPEDDEIDWQIS